jgi:hypothetical protein
MTPKEKAEELFKQYYSYLKANLMNDEEAWEDAKVCALIAVDEILKITWVDKFLTVEEYWEEVKQEIKNYNVSYLMQN